MPTRSSKLDLNQLAKSIVDQAVGDAPKAKMANAKQLAGHKGGKVGGKSRMASLSADEKAALSAMGVAARKKAPATKTEASALSKR